MFHTRNSITNLSRIFEMLFPTLCGKLLFALGAATFFLARIASAQDEPKAKDREFFENKIRPVLIEHCYECHNSADTAESGLALDHRKALLKGGDGGKVVVPGKPKESRLLLMMRHEIDGMEMPMGNAKLDDRILADFEKWISDGAFDPRDKPPTASELSEATAWATKFNKRKQWWSLQPIASPTPPAVEDPNWSKHPIDQFVASKLSEQN